MHPLEQLAANAPDGVTPANLLFADLDEELASTRRMLERYPDEHADWRPHERSMSLSQLAAHVARLLDFARTIVETPGLDMAVRVYQAPTQRTRADILAMFDENAGHARKAIAEMDFASAATNWQLTHGAHVILSNARAPMLRGALMSHVAHHRGQLTVYYRLLGVPVPGLYGPSADD